MFAASISLIEVFKLWFFTFLGKEGFTTAQDIEDSLFEDEPRNLSTRNIKCKDHSHLTGKYRGPAHQHCNLLYRINPKTIKIPVVFHNGKNYDYHLILSAVRPRHGKIECIPNNNEKLISFSVGGLKFLDSFQFMPHRLDKLVKKPGKRRTTRVYKVLARQLQ